MAQFEVAAFLDRIDRAEGEADFRFAADARPCATFLSKLDGGVYRVTDSRWPDEGDDVTVFVSGEVAGG